MNRETEEILDNMIYELNKAKDNLEYYLKLSGLKNSPDVETLEVEALLQKVTKQLEHLIEKG